MPLPVTAPRHTLAMDDDVPLATLRAALDAPASERADRVRQVTRLLTTTGSRKVRNAAAIALIDLDAKEATGLLLDTLARPEIGPEAGSLVYALDELGGAPSLAAILMLVEHGSYEARSGLVELIQAGRIAPFDRAEAIVASDHLFRLKATSDEETAEAASSALDAIARAAALAWSGLPSGR